MIETKAKPPPCVPAVVPVDLMMIWLGNDEKAWKVPFIEALAQVRCPTLALNQVKMVLPTLEVTSEDVAYELNYDPAFAHHFKLWENRQLTKDDIKRILMPVAHNTMAPSAAVQAAKTLMKLEGLEAPTKSEHVTYEGDVQAKVEEEVKKRLLAMGIDELDAEGDTRKKILRLVNGGKNESNAQGA